MKKRIYYSVGLAIDNPNLGNIWYSHRAKLFMPIEQIRELGGSYSNSADFRNVGQLRKFMARQDSIGDLDVFQWLLVNGKRYIQKEWCMR